MGAIRLDGLTKVHPDGFVAVDRVDLTIDEGEFFVLLGPSGCGKTSVLRMIAGLEEPTAGTILVDGVAPTSRRTDRSPVAMMFQEAALYPHLDARENIAFPLRMAGVRPPDIRREVADVAAMLGIRRLLARRSHQLSGGQRQRVAMARSLIRRPRLLLMDEPMSNLDAKLRGELRATIGHLHQSRRMTMIYVTHDQVEAMSLGDRVVVMRHGRIDQIGTPHEVYHRPADAWVATFVGVPTMNLLAGRLVADRTNGGVLDVGGTPFPLGRGSRRSLTSIDDPTVLDRVLDRDVLDRVLDRDVLDRDVVIGVRPHAVTFADRGIVADVEHIEVLGDRCLVTTSVPASPVTVSEHGVDVGRGRALVTVDTALADVHSEQRWRASHLALDVDAIHLFDPVTGRSLATPFDATGTGSTGTASTGVVRRSPAT